MYMYVVAVNENIIVFIINSKINIYFTVFLIFHSSENILFFPPESRRTMSDILQDNVLEFGATEDGDVDIVKSTTTAGHHDVTVTHCTQHSETVPTVTFHTTRTLSTVRVLECHCNPSFEFLNFRC